MCVMLWWFVKDGKIPEEWSRRRMVNVYKGRGVLLLEKLRESEKEMEMKDLRVNAGKTKVMQCQVSKSQSSILVNFLIVFAKKLRRMWWGVADWGGLSIWSVGVWMNAGKTKVMRCQGIEYSGERP